MRPIQIITLLCITLLSACSKVTDTFVFECRVVNASDGLPVSGAQAVVSGRAVSGGSFNPNFQTLGMATTDEQGQFRIEVEKAVYSAFRLTLTHQSYFSDIVAINPDDVPVSEPYTATFGLEHLAWVSVRVLNQNASMAINVEVNAPSAGCATCCDQVTVSHDGEVFDTTINCLAYGARPVMIVGSALNSAGNTVIISQQAYTIPEDTVHIELTY
jgi:hypothetical protein